MNWLVGRASSRAGSSVASPHHKEEAHGMGTRPSGSWRASTSKIDAHRSHELVGGASVLASRLVSSLAPPQRGSPRNGHSTFRFMESLHGSATAHWDHEPRR